MQIGTPRADAGFAKWQAFLAARGQDHVLQFWDELTAEQQSRLIAQLAVIDFDLLERLYHQAERSPLLDVATPRSAAVQKLPVTFEDWEREQQALEEGEKALFAGQVAVLMVAGGQGTRLGFDGPKGTFPIGPVSQNSLFQIHAEKVVALSRRYKAAVPFFIMTSPDNDTATRQFFLDHQYFGLESEQLSFFLQETMPALDQANCKLLLAGRDEIAVSPNGHGGVLTALAGQGHLARLIHHGFKHLFYYQVDNPLVKVADPAFLGYHIQADADVSTKVVAKTEPTEKLGMAVEIAGVPQMIEYSDLPAALAAKRGSDGGLELWAGNTAIHIFSLSFLERLTAGQSLLPYHRALKPVAYLSEAGELITPSAPNAYKFEMFVFDSIPAARKAVFVETARAEEFEPLKNSDGPNSPDTVRATMSALFAGWLEQAGVKVSRRSDNSPAFPIEISPLFALDGEELRDKVPMMDAVSGPLYLKE